MFFANLSALELLALFTSASALTVALYLLIRTRQRLTVSTLRFWQAAQRKAQQRRRRRIDQPLSLLLQLLAIACLLLAIAQPRFGSRDANGADHVLLLDTSSWMQIPAQQAEARRLALEWLRRVPPQDRVMVVRADSLATPVTRFESDPRILQDAVRQAAPSSSALDLQPAFDLAVQSQRLQARRAGEIVYAGPARVENANGLTAPPNFRYLATRALPPNLGLVRILVRRDPAEPAQFHASATIHNYGTTPRPVPFTAGLGGGLVANQLVTVPASADATADFSFRTTASGWLEARIDARDALPADDRAWLEVPSPARLRVAVFSANPEALRPLLSSDARIEPLYLAPADYRPDYDAGLFILDAFLPAAAPARPAIFLRPGAGSAVINRWNPNHPIAAGIRSQDFRFSGARILTPEKADTVVASAAEGPVITARDAAPRSVTLGFHPGSSDLRFELATPLLFANIFQWVAPSTFLRQEVLAATPGAVSVELSEDVQPEQVRVLDARGAALPFTLDGRTLRFFTAEPSTVRVLTPSAERVYALTIPGLGAQAWQPPLEALRGVGPVGAAAPLPKDFWQVLAIAGALLIALEWWLFRPKPLNRYLVALKAASIAAALASVFQPGVGVEESKLAVAVLADTSASIPAGDLQRESQLVSQIEDARGRHVVRVLPFARMIRQPAPQEMASGWKLRTTAGEMGRATDLESAIREASAALPAALVPRIVLISDGRENRGSVARAAWQARQLGIPIDTFALNGTPAPQLRIESVRLPAVAFTGERFPLVLTVTSPARAAAALDISAEGKRLGTTPVTLDPGENQLTVRTAIATPGAIDLVLQLKSESLGGVRFEQAVSVRRPRLLYLTQDPPGMGTHLFATLAAAQFDVVSDVALNGARFDDYQLVLFNNYDLESIPLPRKQELERYVQQGGGLLVIGGERNMYVDKKERAALDPLDRALPATVAPPRSPEGASLILIVDKSSSMEGRKMELARMAAIGVVENLKPIDQVGVLIFDNSHSWAVPLRRAEDRTLIKRLIAGITPDGGTQIAPALAEAYKRMLPATGVYKHIVLLTDGISEEGDSIALAREAANNRITISTVGLGQDVNRAYLERVAQYAKGKAYFLTDPSGLEQILLKDVQEHTGSTTVERSIRPRITHQAEILSGLPMQEMPALKGYVRFQAKPAAETILSIPANSSAEKDDPLYTRWQYGLGRAAVFTSDAKSRWAEAWVSWPGFDKFWANVLRDLLPQAQPGQSTLAYDASSGTLTAEYRQSAAVRFPAVLPAVFVIGPDGFQARMKLERLSADHYRATANIGTRRGLFRVRPLEELRSLPETGLYLPEPELTTYGNNATLLSELSAYTGGRFNPSPKQVFDAAGRSIPATLRLWPGLLAAAILLNLLELALRRLRGAGTRAPALAEAA
jgi:Mg-chelatase subunit ChlD